MDTLQTTPPVQSGSNKAVWIACGCLLLFGFFVGVIALLVGIWIYQQNQADTPDKFDMTNEIPYNYTNTTTNNSINTWTSPDKNANTNSDVSVNSKSDNHLTYADIQNIVADHGYDLTYNDIELNNMMTHSGYTADSTNFLTVLEQNDEVTTITVSTRADNSQAIDPTFLQDIVYAIQPVEVGVANGEWISESLAAAQADITNNTKTISLDDGYMIFSYSSFKLNEANEIITASVTITHTIY